MTIIICEGSIASNSQSAIGLRLSGTWFRLRGHDVRWLGNSPSPLFPSLDPAETARLAKVGGVILLGGQDTEPPSGFECRLFRTLQPPAASAPVRLANLALENGIPLKPEIPYGGDVRSLALNLGRSRRNNGARIGLQEQMNRKNRLLLLANSTDIYIDPWDHILALQALCLGTSISVADISVWKYLTECEVADRPDATGIFTIRPPQNVVRTLSDLDSYLLDLEHDFQGTLHQQEKLDLARPASPRTVGRSRVTETEALEAENSALTLTLLSLDKGETYQMIQRLSGPSRFMALSLRIVGQICLFAFKTFRRLRLVK